MDQERPVFRSAAVARLASPYKFAVPSVSNYFDGFYAEWGDGAPPSMAPKLAT